MSTNRIQGEKNGNAKLQDSDIPEIRRLAKTRTTSWIAQKYGVSAATVSLIVNRKIWKHVPDPTPSVLPGPEFWR